MSVKQNTETSTPTPLTQSITTGLLTLSVHDNLTFDGVEVALNPDLFANISSSENILLGGVKNVVGNAAASHIRQDSSASAFTHLRQDSITSVLTQATISSIPSLGTPNWVQEEAGNAFLRRDTSTATAVNTGGINGGNVQNVHSIKVGDLIEIKVWERKNNHGQIDPTTANVIDRAATKLMQHVKQSASLSSIQGVFHPLAEPKKPTSIPLMTSSSSRPPIAPRNISISSSGAASPIKFDPTPTTSPKSFQQKLSPSPQFLPIRNNNSEKDQIFRDQSVGSSGGGDSIISKLDKEQGISFPPMLIKTTTSSPETSYSPNQDSALLYNNSTIGKSQSFDNDSNIKSCTESPVQQPGEDDIQHQSQTVLDLISTTHILKTKFVMSVTEKSLNALKSSGRTQISLLKQGMYLYQHFIKSDVRVASLLMECYGIDYCGNFYSRNII